MENNPGGGDEVLGALTTHVTKPWRLDTGLLHNNVGDVKRNRRWIGKAHERQKVSNLLRQNVHCDDGKGEYKSLKSLKKGLKSKLWFLS